MSGIPNPVLARMAEMQQANPANVPARSAPKRIPLSVPTLKLAIPEMPGYHLHWFRGSAARIQQAQKAGYEFVTRDEVAVNETGLGNSDDDGNTDLGTRVSVSAGDSGESGEGPRLYLMKIRNEFWDEDQKLIDDRHEAIAAQLRGDKAPVSGGMDASNRYSRGEQKRNMFNPRRA